MVLACSRVTTDVILVQRLTSVEYLVRQALQFALDSIHELVGLIESGFDKGGGCSVLMEFLTLGCAGNRAW